MKTLDRRLRALEVVEAERHPAGMSAEVLARLDEIVSYAEVHGEPAAAALWPPATRIFELLAVARERRDRYERQRGSTAQRA